MVRLVFVILLFASYCVSPAFAEKRIALVIGNSSYKVAPLPNPKNDAKLIAQTLRKIGFEVLETLDASQKLMKKAIRTFSRKIREAGDDGVGLFYYAGHGVQVSGRNYLIPVDAEIEGEGDVDLESIDADAVLAAMEHSGARMNFVILDACRNNPFKRGFRSGTRGLARMNAPTGSLIAYSTSSGNVAADGKGKNSPYTEALAKGILSGQAVERMFRQVRNEVRVNTRQKQTPWESSSLVGDDFYFNLDKRRELEEANQNALKVNEINQETVFWESISGSTNEAMFRSYLEQYPNGRYASLAHVKIKELTTVVETGPSAQEIQAQKEAEAQVAWANLPDKSDASALVEFARQYGQTSYGQKAQEQIIALATTPKIVPSTGQLGRLPSEQDFYGEWAKTCTNTDIQRRLIIRQGSVEFIDGRLTVDRWQVSKSEMEGYDITMSEPNFLSDDDSIWIRFNADRSVNVMRHSMLEKGEACNTSYKKSSDSRCALDYQYFRQFIDKDTKLLKCRG